MTPDDVLHHAALATFPVIVHGQPYATMEGPWQTRSGTWLTLFIGDQRRLCLTLSDAVMALRGYLAHPDKQYGRPKDPSYTTRRKPQQRGAIPTDTIIALALIFAWLTLIVTICLHAPGPWK